MLLKNDYTNFSCFADIQTEVHLDFTTCILMENPFSSALF